MGPVVSKWERKQSSRMAQYGAGEAGGSWSSEKGSRTSCFSAAVCMLERCASESLSLRAVGAHKTNTSSTVHCTKDTERGITARPGPDRRRA